MRITREGKKVISDAYDRLKPYTTGTQKELIAAIMADTQATHNQVGKTLFSHKQVLNVVRQKTAAGNAIGVRSWPSSQARR